MKRAFYALILLSCVLIGCGDDSEEVDDWVGDYENRWGFSTDRSTELPAEGGSFVVKSDSAMYLLALSEFYARGAEGWNNVFVFDTAYNRFSDIVVCKDGPRECDVYGVKIKYVSHHEVRVEVGANTSEKERLLMLNYAPIGTHSNPSLYIENVLIEQEGKKD